MSRTYEKTTTTEPPEMMEPLEEIPDAPKIGEHGKAYWDEHAPLLVKMNRLTALNLRVFEALCRAWHDYITNSDWIDDNPNKLFIEMAGGAVQTHPRIALRQKSLDNCYRLWPRFGLTPEASVKLTKAGAGADEPETELEEFAQGR